MRNEPIRLTRRKLLGWTAAGAAGLLLPDPLMKPRKRVTTFFMDHAPEPEATDWFDEVTLDGRVIPARELAGTKRNGRVQVYLHREGSPRVTLADVGRSLTPLWRHREPAAPP